MKSNLPILEEKGLVNKIKRFFRKLFFANKLDKPEIQEENVVPILAQEHKDEFENYIKVDIDNNCMNQEKDRNELFTKIRNHPELLKSLSNKQLEMLSDFYEKKIETNDNIIEEKQEKIKKLKQAS